MLLGVPTHENCGVRTFLIHVHPEFELPGVQLLFNLLYALECVAIRQSCIHVKYMNGASTNHAGSNNFDF